MPALIYDTAHSWWTTGRPVDGHEALTARRKAFYTSSTFTIFTTTPSLIPQKKKNMKKKAQDTSFALWLL